MIVCCRMACFTHEVTRQQTNTIVHAPPALDPDPPGGWRMLFVCCLCVKAASSLLEPRKERHLAHTYLLVRG